MSTGLLTATLAVLTCCFCTLGCLKLSHDCANAHIGLRVRWKDLPAGPAGPFCSSCYRDGRNAWLLQQLDSTAPHERGYTVGDEVIIATGQTGFDKTEVYGNRNGRCVRCPHLALTWVGFFLSRGLDMAVVACITLLWMAFGWLSQSAAANAFVELKQQHLARLKMRRSIFGSVGSARTIFSGSPNRHMGRPQGPGTIRHGPGSHVAASRLPTSSASGTATAGGCTLPGRSLGKDYQSGSAMQMQSTSVAPALDRPLLSDSGSISPFAVASALAPAFSDGQSTSVAEALSGYRTSSGLYNIHHLPSTRWASAVSLVMQLREQYTHGLAATNSGGTGSSEIADPTLVQQAALLLMAVKNLACLAQVTMMQPMLIFCAFLCRSAI